MQKFLTATLAAGLIPLAMPLAADAQTAKKKCVSCLAACNTCGYTTNQCKPSCRAAGNPSVVADCTPGLKKFPRC
jgi:hypothetical protein